MSGYSIKIACKLIADHTNPKSMADAAEKINNLAGLLRGSGYVDVIVNPHYRDRLVAGKTESKHD